MKIRIWHLLCLTFIVAIIFAMINWFGGWQVFAIAVFLVVLGAFGLPMVIFVVAIALSNEVNKQLDIRSNKAVASCVAVWLVCVAILFCLSLASLARLF